MFKPNTIPLLLIIFSFFIFLVCSDTNFKNDPFLYCSKIETDEQKQTFKSNRKITKAPLEETNGLKLIQSQIVIRHGARVLHGPWPCFPGYKPEWDCNSGDSTEGWVGREDSERQASTSFAELFDAKPHLNPMGGTCLTGQLLSEGHKQHEILGEIIGNAYFANNELFDLKEASKGSLKDFIYFRSTDMQRTRLSGSILLTSMFKTIDPSISPLVNLHLTEYKKDNLFPNTHSCYTIDEAQKMALSGEEYESKFGAKNAEASRLALDLLGIPNDTSTQLWPFLPFDCLYSLICSYQKIPSETDGWTRKNIETILQATQEVVEWQYRANDALYAKRGLKAFIYEMKAFALDALCNPDIDCIKKFIDDEEEALDHFTYILNPTERINGVPFALWSAHDTTILAFLASFGDQFWNKVAVPNAIGELSSPFPSYASALIVEVYNSTTDSKNSKFRLIYNGKVITSAVPLCDEGKELCDIKILFQAEKWATLESIDEKCPSKKPQTASGSLHHISLTFIVSLIISISLI